MIDQPRYPVTPKHPPMHVRVVVNWGGRTFKAARVVHPREKRYCWVRRYDDGREAYLPPKTKGKSKQQIKGEWSPDPDWWIPEKPEAWEAPLPDPLPPEYVPPERRVKDEFRMVDMRPRHRRHVVQEEKVPVERTAWWLDPTAIRYQPVGEVTPDMAFGRLMRAAAVSGAFVTARTAMPLWQDTSAWESFEAWAQEEADRESREREKSVTHKVRFAQVQADRDDWPIAMSWFASLTMPTERLERRGTPWCLGEDQQIIVWRAQLWSYSEIAKELKISIRYVRDIFKRALTEVSIVANLSAEQRETAAMRALRERNRAHHNRSDAYG